MIDKKMIKGFAILASLMLLANVFLPTGIAFAEEDATLAPVAQVENKLTEAVESSASSSEDLDTKASSEAASVAEENQKTEAIRSTEESKTTEEVLEE